MTPAEERAMQIAVDMLNRFSEAARVAMPILARYGQKDDEAWGAYSGCVRAFDEFRKLAGQPPEALVHPKEAG